MVTRTYLRVLFALPQLPSNQWSPMADAPAVQPPEEHAPPLVPTSVAVVPRQNTSLLAHRPASLVRASCTTPLHFGGTRRSEAYTATTADATAPGWLCWPPTGQCSPPGTILPMAPQPCSHGAGLLWGHCFPQHPDQHGWQDVGSCPTYSIFPHLSSCAPNPTAASPCQPGSGPAPVENQQATPAHLAAALHRSPQSLPLSFLLPLPCLLPWSILWPLLVPTALWRQGQQMHLPLLLAWKRAVLVLSATSTTCLPPSRLLFIMDWTSHLRFLMDTGAEVSVIPPSCCGSTYPSTGPSLQVTNSPLLRPMVNLEPAAWTWDSTGPSSVPSLSWTWSTPSWEPTSWAISTCWLMSITVVWLTLSPNCRSKAS